MSAQHGQALDITVRRLQYFLPEDKDPIQELERMVNELQEAGVITERQIDALQHRLPFAGFEWKSQLETGEVLGIGRGGVSARENGAGYRLFYYMPEYLRTHYGIDIEEDELLGE